MGTYLAETHLICQNTGALVEPIPKQPIDSLELITPEFEGILCRSIFYLIKPPSRLAIAIKLCTCFLPGGNAKDGRFSQFLKVPQEWMLHFRYLLGRLLTEPKVLSLFNPVAFNMEPIFPGQIGERQTFEFDDISNIICTQEEKPKGEVRANARKGKINEESSIKR